MDTQQFDSRAEQWWPPRRDLVVLYRANVNRFACFDRYVPSWRGVRVLDVGCGGGYTCEFLARRGALVTGTDLSQGSLDAASRHAKESGLELEYRQCTPDRLPFGDGAFDVATCFDVLEHVDDVGATLSEIRRVLAPSSGRLLFDTMNQTFWSWLALIWLGEVVIRLMPRGTHDWRRFISPQDLAWRLEAAGFTGVELAGVRPQLRRRLPGGLPIEVTAGGSTEILYFGTAVRRAAA